MFKLPKLCYVITTTEIFMLLNQAYSYVQVRLFIRLTLKYWHVILYHHPGKDSPEKWLSFSRYHTIYNRRRVIQFFTPGERHPLSNVKIWLKSRFLTEGRFDYVKIILENIQAPVGRILYQHRDEVDMNWITHDIVFCKLRACERCLSYSWSTNPPLVECDGFNARE